MSTYRLYFSQTLTTSVEVEADDLDAAIEAAYVSDKMPPSQLSAQASGWGQTWWQETNGEWEFDESGYEVDGKFVEVKR